MTKEEVLQKANDYCNEKGYTSETLTDDFKDLFATHFSKRYPDGDINDENIVAEIQFNLNTAFSATSKGVTAKQQAYDRMVEDYTGQINELNKKIANAKKKAKKRQKNRSCLKSCLTSWTGLNNLKRAQKRQTSSRKSWHWQRKALERICTNRWKTMQPILRCRWMRQVTNRQID